MITLHVLKWHTVCTITWGAGGLKLGSTLGLYTDYRGLGFS